MTDRSNIHFAYLGALHKLMELRNDFGNSPFRLTHVAIPGGPQAWLARACDLISACRDHLVDTGEHQREVDDLDGVVARLQKIDLDQDLKVRITPFGGDDDARQAREQWQSQQAEAMQRLQGELDRIRERVQKRQGQLETWRSTSDEPRPAQNERHRNMGAALVEPIQADADATERGSTQRVRAEAVVNVLLLSANPIDSPLNIDEEFRAIDQKIRSSEHRDHVNLIIHGAVRLEDVAGLLMRHKPHVVHFSGHGATTGIELTGPDGEGRRVPPKALANIFSTLKDNVRVVLLNTCDSAAQAKAIVTQIDCAVGMSDTIPDVAAVAFAAAFYEVLGYGRSVQAAYDLALVQLEGTGEVRSLAKLHKRRKVKASEIILVDPRRADRPIAASVPNDQFPPS